MLTILSAILGFLGPFVPEFIKYFRQQQDNVHELAMLALQADAAKSEHLYRMEEIAIVSDNYEQAVLQKPSMSFGVQILDAAKDWPRLIIVPVFYMFAVLEFISGFVRPAVTYAVVGFYLFYKWALFSVASLDHATWQLALDTIWTENDLGILFLVLGYYFGSRTAKATFGGSASTGKAGGG